MLHDRTHLPTFSFVLLTAGIWMGGCIFVIDDDPDSYGHAPRVVDSGDTYWFCEYDATYHDYYWEFQAEVDDADGLSDIYLVDVAFYDAYTGDLVDSLELFEEHGGIWGAWTWERETTLYCGDAYDVVFYVEDWAGNSDSLFLTDTASAPAIRESPVDTWVDCYDAGVEEWLFEFQAVVNDADGFTDVDWVTVTFAEYVTGAIAGEYTLNYEGDGIWGGWIEEASATNTLYCGLGFEYDVTFRAADRSGLTDTFTYLFTP